MARPSKVSEELTSRICKMIAAGVHPKTACQVEGIDYSTYYEWKRRGARAQTDKAEPGDENYASFLAAVTVAEGQMLSTVQNYVAMAAKKDWRAGAYILAKRMPNEFGDKAEIEPGAGAGGRAGRPIPLTDETAEVIRRKILFGERDSKPGEE